MTIRNAIFRAHRHLLRRCSAACRRCAADAEVSTMAATLATSRMIAAICAGIGVVGCNNWRCPVPRVLEYPRPSRRRAHGVVKPPRWLHHDDVHHREGQEARDRLIAERRRNSRIPSRSSSRLTSSIMTTNRNSTMTAPTYTSTSTIPRNSASSSSQMTALLKNAQHQEQRRVHGLRARMMPKAASGRSTRHANINRMKQSVGKHLIFCDMTHGGTARRRRDRPRSWLRNVRRCRSNLAHPCS